MFPLDERRIIAIAFVCISCLTISAVAQITNGTYTIGPNLGVVNYTKNHTTSSCQFTSGSQLITVNYSIDYYSNIAYVNSQASVNQGLPNFSYLYGSPGPNAGQNSNCPADTNVNGPLILYNGNNGYSYSIGLYPGLSAIMYAQGYINPKYLIVGVIYAPPGGVVQGGVAKGNVSYTNSDLVSSTNTTKDSFESSYTESSFVTLSGLGFSIMGWAGGQLSGGPSTSDTTATTTTDTTAVTVQKVSTTQLGVNGPLCPYVGVDHDYDLIGVWVNPVQLITLTNNSGVQPNGYGYSTLDQPGMDVYWVYAGELNGDLAVRSSTTTEFARAWAASEYFPSGGPGLTAQDEQYILKADPYWDCTYESPWTNGETSPCAKPPDSTRFTESGGDLSFPYTQPAPGDSPSYQTYTWSYTNTDSNGIDSTYKTSQTFGSEQTLGATIFGIGIQDTLSQAWTITNIYETSSQFSSSNTSTATATIWQPPCNVVDGVCSPVYPPSNAYNPISCTPITSLGQAFGQGYTMYLYQDNLYGTFLMEPYGQ